MSLIIEGTLTFQDVEKVTVTKKRSVTGCEYLSIVTMDIEGREEEILVHGPDMYEWPELRMIDVSAPKDEYGFIELVPVRRKVKLPEGT